ncbi:MAG TPA: CbtA family protein [Acidimicrobiales bacterium]
MVRTLLIRGLIAGLLAGVVGFGVARVLGEPQVNRAIGFESYVEYNVRHEPPEKALVSRATQSSYGLGTGTLLFGTALGGIFALVFAFNYGRLAPFRARGTALLIGALGLLGAYVVPILKYPANPPSIGDPDTIGKRTGLYLLMVLASVVSLMVAVRIRRTVIDRWGSWNATLVAVGFYAVLIGIFYVALPGVNEVPQQGIHGLINAVVPADRTTFPPVVLWRFRVASLAIEAAMWATIALVFGALAEKVVDRPAAGPIDLAGSLS